LSVEGLSNLTGLSSEDINAAADAAQAMPTNPNHLDYNLEEPEDAKKEDTDADVWGIKGLLGIIKIENSDKSKLALGVDLTTLGLNMNQPEYSLYDDTDSSARPLYPMFNSPWQDLSRTQTIPDFDPKYDLPACYRMSAPPSAQSKMTKFSDETLFYIFYAMPQDVLQDAAAYELYPPYRCNVDTRTRRNWRYHKGIQLWLTKPTDSVIAMKSDTYENSDFIFWDVNLWQKTKVRFPKANVS
jgi:CCR4-NOT transcription complex subunit 2